MKKSFIIIAQISITSLSFSQNLVQNSSFESYTNCPTTVSELSYAYPWESPSQGTPDFYHACNGPCDSTYLDPVCVPININGYQQAKTGSGYAGIFVYEYNNYREYIQCPLSSTLVAGEVYEIGFYASLPEANFMCSAEFGMAFQNSPTLQSNYLPLAGIVPVLQTSLISDTVNWVHVTIDYTANGTENYTIIGNFSDNTNTVTSVSCGNYSSYYFIDDVYVILKSTSGIDASDNLMLKVYPNPSSDKLFFGGLSNQTFGFSILDSFGKVYKSGEVNQNDDSIDISELHPGIFFIELISAQSQYIKKFIKN
ncbi:MAG: T9SS type A sorting domain-containing protein [Candidatus Kapabacteria bacterium]|nr:T9SS type A sorting domain-containing protein [Candidatus Kapabacteria bacterium]